MSLFTRLFAASLLSAALGLHGLHAAPSGFVLEIEASNPAGGTGRLYYDVGQWYSVHDSCAVTMPAGTVLQACRFVIPLNRSNIFALIPRIARRS